MAGGPNVGFATLSLIPSMKGSEAILAREASKAGGSAGGLFAGGFKGQMGGLGKVVAGGIAAGVVAAGVGLFKLGDKFDRQFDRIRVSSGQTGAALEGLKGSFKNVLSTTATDFDGAGNAIAVLNQKLGLIGKPLEALSKQFIDLSRITKTDLAGNLESVTGLFNQFKIAGEDQASTLDLLFRASQASGVGVADLASQITDSAQVFKSLGFNAHTAAVIVAGLGKAGLKAADVMPALSRVLAKGAKEGKKSITVYQDLIRSIRTAPDDAKAASIAFDALGAKAGPKFAQLIRSGQFAFDSLGESILEGSETINKASEDTADFSEKWQIFKNKILVGLEPIATKVFDAVGNGMDKISAWWTENGPGVQEWFTNFGTTLRDTIAPAAEFLWTALKDHLLPKLTEFGTWLADNQSAMAAFAAILFVIGAAVLIATSPILAMIIGVIALGAAAAYAYDEWSWFKTAVDAAATAIGFLNDVMSTLFDWLDRIVGAAESAGSALDAIPGVPDLSGPVGFIGDAMESVILGPLAPVKQIKDFFGFDNGGVIPGPLGQPRLAVVHAGETVVPTHKSDWAMGPQSASWYGNGQPIVIENVMLLDGKVVARNQRHLARTGQAA